MNGIEQPRSTGPQRRPSGVAAPVAGEPSNGATFAHWREVVCRRFTQLSPERHRSLAEEGRAFSGHIDQAPLPDGASVSRIAASPQTVCRGKADIAVSPCDSVFVNFQIRGRSVVRQREIETVLPEGAITLLDARQPFEMRFDAAFEQVCYHLPLQWFTEARLETGGWLARRASSRTPSGSMLLTTAWDWLHGEATVSAAAPEAPGAEVLISLLAEAFASRDQCQGDAYLRLVQQYVEAHCAETALSPGAVAGHYRMSTRYLHRLFARSGVTFGTYLRQCRVETAKQLMARHPSLPLTDIARRSGFSDPAAFSRAFRREAGLPPRAYRLQVRGRA